MSNSQLCKEYNGMIIRSKMSCDDVIFDVLDETRTLNPVKAINIVDQVKEHDTLIEGYAKFKGKNYGVRIEIRIPIFSESKNKYFCCINIRNNLEIQFAAWLNIELMDCV